MDVKAKKTLTSHSTQGARQAAEIQHTALSEKFGLAGKHKLRIKNLKVIR